MIHAKISFIHSSIFSWIINKGCMVGVYQTLFWCHVCMCLYELDFLEPLGHSPSGCRRFYEGARRLAQWVFSVTSQNSVSTQGRLWEGRIMEGVMNAMKEIHSDAVETIYLYLHCIGWSRRQQNAAQLSITCTEQYVCISAKPQWSTV